MKPPDERSISTSSATPQRGKQQRSGCIDAGINAERCALVDVGFDIVCVKAFGRFTLRLREGDFENPIFRLQRSRFERSDSIIHQPQHIEMAFNELYVGDAGI